MTSALILCRTPLQARLIEEVIREENVTQFDLLYFTQQDAPEDRSYFARLSQHSKRAQFVHVPPSHFDILNHIKLRSRAGSFMRDLRHDVVMMASIDNFVFNAIARKQRRSELVTFDDGVGNIIQSGIYRAASRRGLEDIYRGLFGASAIGETRDKIVRHYTIFPNFENIVPKSKLRFITLNSEECLSASEGPVFFVGQPFHQVLTEPQISRMTAYLREQKVDYYVRHPREICPLDIGAPELDKQGLLAEEAIFKACRGSKPTIIGLTSAVLFSIPVQCTTRKMMLIFRDCNKFSEITKLGSAVGCVASVVP